MYDALSKVSRGYKEGGVGLSKGRVVGGGDPFNFLTKCITTFRLFYRLKFD